MGASENFEINKDKAIIKTLTQNHSYVCYVDLQRRKLFRIKSEQLPAELIAKFGRENGIEFPEEGQGVDLDQVSAKAGVTDLLQTVLLSLVPARDKEMVKEKISIDLMEEEIASCGTYQFDFRVIIDGDIKYYRMRVIKDNTGNEMGRIISFANIDSFQNIVLQNENTRDVIMAMTEEYETLVQVNMDTKEVNYFRISQEMKEKIDRLWPGRFPLLSSKLFADNFVYPEDRSFYINRMNEKNIFNSIKDNNGLSVTYRMERHGALEWFETKIIHSDMYLSNCIILGIRNINDEVMADTKHRIDIKNREFIEEIAALSVDILAIFTANLETDESTCNFIGPFGEGVNQDVVPGEVTNESYSSRMKNIADTLVHPDDRQYFIKNTSAEAVKKGLETLVSYPVQFRILKSDGNAVHMLIKYSKNPVDENSVVAGIIELEEEFQERERAEKLKKERQRVIELLAGDFFCVDYVALTERAADDVIVNFRTSREIASLVPGWDNELHMTKRLDLMAGYAVYGPDRARFIEETRRGRIVASLEKDGVYFVNFRVLEKRKIKYYQLKLTADRDPETNELVGYILGFHNTDEETRQELKRESELQEATANAERMILTRTSELKEKNLELARMNDEIVELLGDVIELRDEDSGEHVKRVKAFTYILAKTIYEKFPKYGLTTDDVDYYSSASALHDVGKILISDNILLKPGKLTADEFEIMKGHTVKGCKVLNKAPKSWNAQFVKICKDICMSHHEKWDGKGYPQGLKGDDIPLSAQIVSIADCFDALTSKRVYKDAIDPYKAYDMIMNGECGQFSDDMLKALEYCKKEFIQTAENTGSVVMGSMISVYGIEKLKGTRILLVDDDELSLDINKEILEAEGATVDTATNGADAVNVFEADKNYDVIIMDVIMPVMNGIDATRRIREMEVGRSNEVPIIGLTAEGNSSNTQALLSAGVSACMAKPLVVGELTRILISGIRGRVETMERALEDTKKIANTDALTNVKNVTAYSDMVNTLADEIQINKSIEFAVVICDINYLKEINDSYGHDIGDQYIKNGCKIVCQVFDHSPVYRIGGDEFAVIVRGSDYEQCESKMITLKERVEKARQIPSVERGRAEFSAGIAIYDPDIDESVNEVIKRADSAMYKEKRAMKGIQE